MNKPIVLPAVCAHPRHSHTQDVTLEKCHAAGVCIYCTPFAANALQDAVSHCQQHLVDIYLVFTESLDVTLFPVSVLILHCFVHSITNRSYGESSSFSSCVWQDVHLGLYRTLPHTAEDSHMPFLGHFGN